MYLQHCKVTPPQEKELNQVAKFYRSVQMLVIMCNKCLQQLFWPNLQFTGAAMIISSLYSLIILGDLIPGLAILGIILFTVLVVIFVFFSLDVGSRPMLLSTKLLSSWKKLGGIVHHYPRGKCWWTKFFKSCRPIHMYMGPFHVVDRQRAVILMRFCLQRTFFFVVKTRSAESSVVIHFVFK